MIYKKIHASIKEMPKFQLFIEGLLVITQGLILIVNKLVSLENKLLKEYNNALKVMRE